jgi:mycothiol system anti-sigma-R factor
VADDADCSETLRELYTFLDGELTMERRARISGHLHGCNDCLEAFDFEAELKAVISMRCRDEVPQSLRQRVAAAVAELSGEPPPKI